MKTWIVAGALAVGSASLVGCVEMDVGGPEGEDSTTRQQAVTVVPEFSIAGTEAFPEALSVQDLGLTISEIRLEPVTGESQLAYSTRDAIHVDFDVKAGETLRQGEPIELPEKGRYLVSIRLEPVENEDTGETIASFAMNGHIAEGTSVESVDVNSDGRPQPLPFDESSTDGLEDQPSYPSDWTAFTYQSRRAVFFTFDDVVFERGQQYLSFNFDVNQWAGDVVEPISTAVTSTDSTASGDNPVDTTDQVDAKGAGIEALVATGNVQTSRR